MRSSRGRTSARDISAGGSSTGRFWRSIVFASSAITSPRSPPRRRRSPRPRRLRSRWSTKTCRRSSTRRMRWRRTRYSSIPSPSDTHSWDRPSVRRSRIPTCRVTRACARATSMQASPGPITSSRGRTRRRACSRATSSLARRWSGSTTKSPFLLRNQLSISSGVPKEKFVIEPCWIGGDFGAKGLSVEEFHCYYLARATGRPVKHIRRYLDDVQGTCVRHASKTTIRAGVTKDGRIVALHVKIVFDGGAYAAGKIVPNLIPGRIPKTPYSIPNTFVERMAVYTNTVPGGFLRAPGDVQILFALESHIDVMARALGIDPIEFRLRNALREGDTDIDGHPHQDYNAVAVLEALREHLDREPSREPERGRGIALIARHIGGGKTSVHLLLRDDGSVEVRTGNPDVGMGVLTMVQRVVARALDLEPARVHVRRAGTGEVGVDPGVGGSRSTHIVGEAALDAARQLRGRLEALGYPEKRWEDAIGELRASGPVEIVGSYDAEATHGEAEWTGISAYHVDLSVDPQTGALRIHDVLLITDAGTIINPVAYRGQVNGGFVFGIGHALTEELRVEGGKIVNLNLGDYKLPTQMDVPPLRYATVKAAAGPGPFGAKAIGELTTAGVAPAIANAIFDACGVRIVDLPLTAERIFEALHA